MVCGVELSIGYKLCVVYVTGEEVWRNHVDGVIKTVSDSYSDLKNIRSHFLIVS